MLDRVPPAVLHAARVASSGRAGIDPWTPGGGSPPDRRRDPDRRAGCRRASIVAGRATCRSSRDFDSATAGASGVRRGVTVTGVDPPEQLDRAASEPTRRASSTLQGAATRGSRRRARGPTCHRRSVVQGDARPRGSTASATNARAGTRRRRRSAHAGRRAVLGQRNPRPGGTCAPAGHPPPIDRGTDGSRPAMYCSAVSAAPSAARGTSSSSASLAVRAPRPPADAADWRSREASRRPCVVGVTPSSSGRDGWCILAGFDDRATASVIVLRESDEAPRLGRRRDEAHRHSRRPRRR